MSQRKSFLILFLMIVFLAQAQLAISQTSIAPPTDPELVARRMQTEKELQSIAVIERKMMIPMRDGVRLATDVYRPKDLSKRYPTIFVRTPYNFNYWDVGLGAPRDMSEICDWVKHGYAYVIQNERGKFFSEGVWDILGAPRTDGTDAFSCQP